MVRHLNELLRRYPVKLEIAAQSLHDTLELDIGVDVRGLGLNAVFRPAEHRLELLDLDDLEAAAHDQLHHGFAEGEEVRILEELEGSRLDERHDHVDELGGRGVAPVVVLEGAQHHAHDLDAQELLRVVEAGLQQLRQVVVLGCADQARDTAARQRTRARVQIIQQDAERLRIEFYDVELKCMQRYDDTSINALQSSFVRSTSKLLYLSLS